MTKLYGDRVASVFTIFIIWTCLAGLFAMTLGYSRIVYAAAKNGDFFSFFDRLHPAKGYPWAAALAYFNRRSHRILLLLPAEDRDRRRGRRANHRPVYWPDFRRLHVVHREKKHPLPFRMWLYPLPSLLALVGWVLLLASTAGYLLSFIMIIYGSGLLVFIVRRPGFAPHARQQ